MTLEQNAERMQNITNEEKEMEHQTKGKVIEVESDEDQHEEKKEGRNEAKQKNKRRGECRRKKAE